MPEDQQPVDAGQSKVDKAFDRARRHSSRVRVLKFALPTVAVVLALGFLVTSYVSIPDGMAVQIGATSVQDGKLVMDNPKLDGFTRDNRAYSMSASRAVQAIGDTSRIDLEGITARLPLDESNWVSIDAAAGTLDRTANRLQIGSEMTVSTDTGITARFQSADIDVSRGNVDTQDPVRIELDGSRIAADSMQVVERGKVVVFERNVRVEIDGDRVSAASQDKGDTQ